MTTSTKTTTRLSTTIAAHAAAAHQTIAEYLADEAMRISAIRLGRATEDALALPRQQTTTQCQGAKLNGERCESGPDVPLNLCEVNGRKLWLCGGCSDAWCPDGSCSDEEA